MDLGLQGRVAIVAAASKGLGRAVAEDLAREGATVAICARTTKELEQAAAQIQKSTGREVFHQTVDVTNPDAVSHFVAAVEGRFGPSIFVLPILAVRHLNSSRTRSPRTGGQPGTSCS